MTTIKMRVNAVNGYAQGEDDATTLQLVATDRKGQPIEEIDGLKTVSGSLTLVGEKSSLIRKGATVTVTIED